MYMTSLVPEHGKQSRQCFANFSMTSQAEILSIETSDFPKQKSCLSQLISCFSVAFPEYLQVSLSSDGNP